MYQTIMQGYGSHIYFWFMYDLQQKYHAPQVQSE